MVRLLYNIPKETVLAVRKTRTGVTNVLRNMTVT